MIVTEWLVNGSLNHLLSDEARYAAFDPTKKVKIVVGVCMAMRHAHNRGVIHRDLKPSNILLDENYEPRVSDFGSATAAALESTVTRGVGTLMYRAPEAHTSEHSPKMDVFSFGMMLWEILTARNLDTLFPNKDFVGWQRYFEAGGRPPLSGICEDAARLLTNCWGASPHARSTFDGIINYLERIHYQLLPNKVNTDAIEEYVNRIKASIEPDNLAPGFDVT
jgi:serine/threonine protein kinase